MAKKKKEMATTQGTVDVPEIVIVTPEAPAPEPTVDTGDIIVGDPQVLRPVELPLVVKLPEGKNWQNSEQAEYVNGLNAYAYKNPKKWAKKKNVLIARLIEIGKDPSRLSVYKGENEVEGNLKYSDKRIQA